MVLSIYFGTFVAQVFKESTKGVDVEWLRLSAVLIQVIAIISILKRAKVEWQESRRNNSEE